MGWFFYCFTAKVRKMRIVKESKTCYNERAMMMKEKFQMKISRLFAAVCMFLCLITGAAARAEHIHVFDQWDRDMQYHWPACSCGEAAPGEKEPHTLQYGICFSCSSSITTYPDGSGDIDSYNEFMHLIRSTFYNEYGVATDDYRYVNEWDAEGCLTAKKCYWNGFLTEECFYTPNERGEGVPVLQLGYEKDGSASRNEYNQQGHVVRMVLSDKNGWVTFEENTEYTYEGEDTIVYTKVSGRFTEGESYLRETNRYGDVVLFASYDGDGTEKLCFRNEFGYDAEGNKQWGRQYQKDVLVSESLYAVGYYDDFYAFTYEKQCISYLPDGGREVREYDAYGNEISCICYDADGVQRKE